MENLRSYLKIARFHHWIKQLFVLPGVVFAYFMVGISDVKVKNFTTNANLRQRKTPRAISKEL